MNIDKFLMLAENNFVSGELGPAAHYCDRVLELIPDHPKALHILVLINYRSGNLAQALVLLERAMNTSAPSPDASLDYGIILSAANRNAEAVVVLKKVIQLQPKNIAAYINIGVAMRNLGDFRDAESNFRHALKLDAASARALTNLGELLRVVGRIDEAVECFQSALESGSKIAVIHHSLGVAYEDLGKLDDAIASYRKALELRPEYPDPKVRIGKIAMNKGDFSGAIEHLETVSTPDARSMYLTCLLELRRYEEFFGKLADLARVDPANLRVAALSAYAAEQLQRKDPYPLCPDPLNYIKIIKNFGGLAQDGELMDELLEEVAGVESAWNPKGVSMVNGFLTAPTLFDKPAGKLAFLKELLEMEIEAYRKNFSSSPTLLFRDWPKRISLRGWFMKLVRGGFQDVHCHPTSWVSGVLYLRSAVGASSGEGALEFMLKGADYPDITREAPSRVHIPATGQLVLFPSSLWHRTIPFSTDEDRLCIAFDVVPN